MTARGVKPSTIIGYMCEIIASGLPLDVERLGLSSQIRGVITDTIRAPPINSGRCISEHYITT